MQIRNYSHNKYSCKYIGNYYEIAETSERIYIGTDFPDEFSHSEDTRGLKGANIKAKANMVSAVGEMIQIAAHKAEYPDYEGRHGSKAEYGWYRYDTRFGLPVYDEGGKLLSRKIFMPWGRALVEEFICSRASLMQFAMGKIVM